MCLVDFRESLSGLPTFSFLSTFAPLCVPICSGLVLLLCCSFFYAACLLPFNSSGIFIPTIISFLTILFLLQLVVDSGRLEGIVGSPVWRFDPGAISFL